MAWSGLMGSGKAPINGRLSSINTRLELLPTIDVGLYLGCGFIDCSSVSGLYSYGLYRGIDYIVMVCIVMACIVMADIVMAAK